MSSYVAGELQTIHSIESHFSHTFKKLYKAYDVTFGHECKDNMEKYLW